MSGAGVRPSAPAERRPGVLGTAGLVVVVLLLGLVAVLNRSGDDGGGAPDPSASTTTLAEVPDLGPVVSPSTLPDEPSPPGPGPTDPTGDDDGTSGGGTSVATTTSGPPRTTTTLAGARPLRIGNVGSYSGPLGTAFAPGRDLLQRWVAAVNGAGGIAGHRLELTVRDDGGDATRHQQAVRSLVEDEGVVAFVGDLSFASGAAADYLEGVGVPVVGGDALTPPWHSSTALFPIGSGLVGQAYSQIELAVASGAEEVGVVVCTESSYCKAQADAALPAVPLFGATVTGYDQVGPLDAEVPCNGPDAILVFGQASLLSRVQEACGGDRFVIGGTLAYLTGVAADGAILSIPIVPPSGAGAAGADYRALLAQGGALTDGYATSVAYLSARLLERSAAVGRWPAEVRSADVVAGLRPLRRETLGGLAAPFSYGTGPAPDPRCGYPVLASGGRWLVLTTTPRCY